MMHALFRGVETQLHFSTRCKETGNLPRVPISREIRYGSVNQKSILEFIAFYPRRFNLVKFHSRHNFWKAGSRPSLSSSRISRIEELYNIGQEALRDTCYQLNVIRIRKGVSSFFAIDSFLLKKISISNNLYSIFLNGYRLIQ